MNNPETLLPLLPVGYLSLHSVWMRHWRPQKLYIAQTDPQWNQIPLDNIYKHTLKCHGLLSHNSLELTGPTSTEL